MFFSMQDVGTETFLSVVDNLTNHLGNSHYFLDTFGCSEVTATISLTHSDVANS